PRRPAGAPRPLGRRVRQRARRRVRPARAHDVRRPHARVREGDRRDARLRHRGSRRRAAAAARQARARPEGQPRPGPAQTARREEREDCPMNRTSRLIVGMALALTAQLAGAQVLFWSTQASPVEEAQRMREQVLAGFPGGVDFQPQESGPFFTRLEAELQAGRGEIGVVGALHGELAIFADRWVDLSGVDLGGVEVSEAFMELGRLGTDEQKYLPWMQANYVMAANRQALEYLPEGADLDALTYEQLVEWAANVHEATGQPRFGFPAGPQGLRHRFFQGFLLPSFTGSTVTRFRSPEAEQAWELFKELWQHTNPASTNYGFMQEPLLTGDVWIAFDHIARLADAFNQRPDDFV